MQRLWVTALIAAVGFAGCSSSSDSSSVPPTRGFQIARGSYLVNDLIDCAGCHTADPSKPFGGGVKFPIDAQGHFVMSRNITSDPSTGLQLTEDQFVQTFQTGADFRNPGQVLLVMPWLNFRWMTESDIRAIYQFLKVLPAASNAIPPDDKGTAASQRPLPLPAVYDEGEEPRPLPPATSPDLLGPPSASAATPDPDNMVRGAAILPLAYAKMPNFSKRTPEEQATFGRGSYLVNAAGCAECHTNKGGQRRNIVPGPDFVKIPADSYLTGGAAFSVPGPLASVLGETRSMSANLIGTSGFFNEADTTYLSFASIIDAIAHTDEDPPRPLAWPMPAGHFRNLPPDDLRAIYTYMKVLAEDYDHTDQVDKTTQDWARYCTSSADCGAGETCFVDSSADKTVNNQCVGKACMADEDCSACQKCANGTCQQPGASDACLTSGL